MISDLHLTPERPDIIRAFVSYMEKKAPEADACYILGDFFEYWLGDDAMEPFHHTIANLLRCYTDSKKKLYLMAGNRDFAIGKHFLKATGAVLLKDPCLMELNHEKVLLMHGDLLCTKDYRYLRYRSIIQSSLVLSLLRRIPISYRLNIARKIRYKSQQEKSTKSLNVMDVTTNQVIKLMDKYGVKTIIHGHTHCPKIHNVTLASGSGRRIVLGNWDKQGWILISDQSGIHLKSFDIAFNSFFKNTF